MAAKHESGSSDALPDLTDVVDRIGVGMAQGILLLSAGGVWLVDAAMVMAISCASKLVAAEWNLPGHTRGLCVSLLYIGLLVGNLCGGIMGDAWGRRYPIFLCYLLVAALSWTSACATAFPMLASLNFALGIAMGLGQPACVSMITECTPIARRLVVNAMAQMLFAVGEGFTAILIWRIDENIKLVDWRLLFRLAAIPAVIFFVFAQFTLWESPSYLAQAGDRAGAERVLAAMARSNRREHVDVRAFQVAAQSHDRAALHHAVFGRRMALHTAMTAFGAFALNCALYGGIYAFPQVLPDSSFGVAAAPALLVGVAWEIPGHLLGITCGVLDSKRGALVIAHSMLFVAAGVFAWAGSLTPEQTTPLIRNVLFDSYLGQKVFASMCFIVVYQYAAELYPTSARATGTAFVFAIGRLGSAMSSTTYEWMLTLTRTWTPFFYLMSVISAAAAAGFLLVPEHAGAPERDPEDCEPLLDQRAKASMEKQV